MALSDYPLFGWINWLTRPGTIVTASSQAGDLSPAEVVTRSPQDFWRSARAAEPGVEEWIEVDFGEPRDVGLAVVRWDRDGGMPAPTDTIRLRLYGLGTDGGLLPEPIDFADAGWTKNKVAVTADAIAAPDGTLTADKVAATDTGNSEPRWLRESVGILEADTIYTASICAKAGEVGMMVFGWRTSAPDSAMRFFNLETGAIGSTFGGAPNDLIVHPPQSLGDGWWRFAVTASSADGGWPSRVDIMPADKDGDAFVTGDGSSGFYVWGAELVAGDAPSRFAVYDSGAVACDVDPIKGVWSHPLEAPVAAQAARVDFSFADEVEAEAGQLWLGPCHQFSRALAWEWQLGVEDTGDIGVGPGGRTDATSGKVAWLLSVTLPRLDAADRRAWEEADYALGKTGQLVFVADASDPNRSTIAGHRDPSPTVRRNLPFAEKSVRIREDT